MARCRHSQTGAVRIANPRSVQASLFVALYSTATAVAQWPTDPESPLAVGQAEAIVELRQEVGDDGGTWLAWVDSQCLGEIRLQRIDRYGSVMAPGGLVLPGDLPICATMEILLAVAPDDSAIVQGGGLTTDRPIHRIAPDGTPLWGTGVHITSWIGGFGAALGLDNGDVLLAGHAGFSMFVSRHDIDGTELWTAEIPVPSGPNKRVLGLVPDDAGGAFIVWDRPLAYTRLVEATHLSATGVPTWPDPLVVVPPDPSSSRHTDPVVLADGRGGAVLVFVEGHETPDTPVPLLMQRFDAAGALDFGPDGVRVSLDAERQYDPVVARDEATDELIIAWRSGPFAAQELRAQRMTVAGDRLWGDTGVTIAEMGAQGSSHFDAVWDGGTLAGVVSFPDAGSPSVFVHRVDGAGVVLPAPVAISGETDAGTIAAAGADQVIAVSWFEHTTGIEGDLFAQRVNPDGSLGLIPGDLDGDGDVDIADLLALLAAWGPCPGPCIPDLDADGTVGISDFLMLLASWT